MAYARHKLRQCKQRKPNWKTKASQQHLSAQRSPCLPPLSPPLPCPPFPSSLSYYSCHLLYNLCQKPLDSAPSDTHWGLQHQLAKGCVRTPLSISRALSLSLLPCLTPSFCSFADPFCEVFSSLLLCLFAHLSPWIGTQIASSASLDSS